MIVNDERRLERSTNRVPSVLLVCANPGDNTLGRAYALSLVLDELGWRYRIVGSWYRSIWEPLRGSEFARRIVRIPAGLAGLRPLAVLMDNTDIVVAVKPRAESLGRVLAAPACPSTPVAVDMDDPDLEVRSTWLPLRSRIRTPSVQFESMRLRRHVRRLPLMVSNPELARMHGGVLVPHVRPEAPELPSPTRTPMAVGFIGTALAHKGIDVLREAVSTVQDAGCRLLITADPPRDRKPWEHWCGTTSIDALPELLAEVDVVAIPSLLDRYGPAQLPVKLIDAMLAGRAIIVSDIAPLRWAVGDAGIVTPIGSAASVASALRTLAIAERRRGLGAAARRRGERMFTPAVVAPTVERFLMDTMRAAKRIRRRSGTCFERRIGRKRPSRHDLVNRLTTGEGDLRSDA